MAKSKSRSGSRNKTNSTTKTDSKGYTKDFVGSDKPKPQLHEFLRNKSKVTRYVLCFGQCEPFGDMPRAALLVRKAVGTLHAGQLNLPGGKVQKGESFEEAAVRELLEETGYHCTFPEKLGVMYGGDLLNSCDYFFIEVYRMQISNRQDNPGQIAGEPEQQPKWYTWPNLNRQARELKLIPNLLTIIPLCICGVKDWEMLIDKHPSITDSGLVSAGLFTQAW